MKDLKPFQIIIMVVFGVVALAGLFLFANFKGFNSGVAPVGKVTIWGTLPERSVQDTIMNLRNARGELEATTYYEYPADTFDRDLADAIAAGRGPDMILISQEQLAGLEDKIQLIENSATSARTFRDTYLPEAELYLFGKGAYGIPFVLDPLVLYYNRTHLTAAGAATPPATWEAVAGLSPALTRLDQVGGIARSGIALGTYENVENARAVLSLFFMQAGYSISERTIEGTRSTLSRAVGRSFGVEPAVAAASYYLQFANPAKTSYTWNRAFPSARQAFLAGNVSLYPGFASEEPLITSGNPNLDFDMAPIPQPATAATPTTYGRLYAFAIPKASQNQPGALRVAFALTANDSLPLFARALSMAPAQRALLIPEQGSIFEPVFYPQALMARGWLSPSPRDTDALFATMISSITSGRQDPTSAITTLDQAITAGLR
jgi:ABC-type glycerol-3-phosphate transport system substrate-binding protein